MVLLQCIHYSTIILTTPNRFGLTVNGYDMDSTLPWTTLSYVPMPVPPRDYSPMPVSPWGYSVKLAVQEGR